MFQTKAVKQIKTQISYSVTRLFENRAFYEIMYKNNVEPGTPLMKIWHMRNAHWITRTTNTHSEYVILIAFPLHQ
jgi:hypothetical protein